MRSIGNIRVLCFVVLAIPYALAESCSLHWSDLHRMLFDSLSDLKGCIRMGHRVIAYTQSGSSVTVRVQKLEGDGGQETVEFTADVVIAADGSNSTVRRQMFPTEQRR